MNVKTAKIFPLTDDVVILTGSGSGIFRLNRSDFPDAAPEGKRTASKIKQIRIIGTTIND